MKKITVRDSAKEFHSFTDENVRAERDGEIYDIITFRQENENNSPRRVTLASFYRPMWVKESDVQPKPPKADPYAYDINQDEIPTDFRSSRTEDNLDPFTARALQGRDKEPKPDYNSLAPHTPIGTASDRVFDKDVMKEGTDALGIGDQRKLEDIGPVIDEAAPVTQESFTDLKAKYGKSPAELATPAAKEIKEQADDLLSGVQDTDISTTMADSIAEERDPLAVIAEAEQRHKSKKK